MNLISKMMAALFTDGGLPEHSPQRSKWLSRMIGLSAHTTPLKILTGLETWFTLSAGQAIFPPPRYKMAIVTWFAVFLLITLLYFAMSCVVGNLPPVLHALVATLILVALMTYVVMPRMTRVFAHWLYPAANSSKVRSS